MPRIMEKEDILKNVVDASRLNRRLHELMSKTPKLSGNAYKFHRADAYEGELG